MLIVLPRNLTGLCLTPRTVSLILKTKASAWSFNCGSNSATDLAL